MIGWRPVVLLVVMVLVVQGAAAQSSTQQFNKIFLEPFYRASMVQNTNYTYVVSVRPPDGVSGVKSAIINLDAWINPTRTFSAWVNGIACRTPDYTITTTYASAGRAVPTFDCGNVINASGTYTVTLRVSGGNIGSSTAWLDLTYMNAPIGEIEVHGTEYVAGDDGKMFLQLLDASQQPIDDSECFLTIWYPNGSKFLNNTYMLHLAEGVYFKNFLVPNVNGVYPASAKCYRSVDFANSVILNNVTEGFESNSWTGGTGWSKCPFGDPDCQEGWDYENTVPLATIVTNATAGAGGCYSGNYCAKFTGSYGWIERGFPDVFVEGTSAYNISYSVKFKGFQTNEKIEFYVFDGNWHLIRQIGPSVGAYSNDVWYRFSEVIEGGEFNLETILVGWFTKDMPSTGDEAYIDAINVSLIGANITLTNDTDYEILRGSGEVHVSNLEDNLVDTIVNVASGGDGTYEVTSCGGFTDGRCATHVDGLDANWTEEELDDFIYVTGLKAGDAKISYRSPFSVDCTALYWVKEWNGTGWVEFTNYSVGSEPASENCEIVLERPVVLNGQYQFWLRFDDYMRWEVEWSQEQIEAVFEDVVELCGGRNWTYSVPITNDTEISTDTITRYCHRAYDDKYWSDLYYADSYDALNAGEYESYIHEMRVYMKNIYDKREYLMSGQAFPMLKNINVTVGQVNQTVTSIKNDTSLLAQMWLWLQSVFDWVGTDNDQNATTSVASLVQQSVAFVEAQYYQQVSSAIVAQVQRGGVSVTGATCDVGVYYPNMTAFASGSMVFTGIDGMYSYAWTPAEYGSHIAQVNCSGGGLQGQVQTSGSLGVSAPSTGVIMQSVS